MTPKYKAEIREVMMQWKTDHAATIVLRSQAVVYLRDLLTEIDRLQPVVDAAVTRYEMTKGFSTGRVSGTDYEDAIDEFDITVGAFRDQGIINA